jgi:hypothetical protein
MSCQTTVEETKRIDIRYMQKKRYLTPGTSGSLSWTCNGEPSGNINFRSLNGQIILNYRFRDCSYGEDWESVKQTIYLDSTPCHFGGTRLWFICPHCQQRCAVLCSAGKYFLCRQCSGLSYYSQLKGKIDRINDQKNKLADRMFDDTGWRKKKGMHQTTFDRLYSKHCLLEMQFDDAFCARFGKLVF